MNSQKSVKELEDRREELNGKLDTELGEKEINEIGAELIDIERDLPVQRSQEEYNELIGVTIGVNQNGTCSIPTGTGIPRL